MDLFLDWLNLGVKWVAFGVIIIFFLRWLIASIRIIGPDEMGVKVIFGNPVALVDTGWVIDFRLPLGVRFFKCFIKLYPKKRFSLDYPKKSVITKEGYYPVEENSQAARKSYGSLTLIIDSAAIVRFPRRGEMRITENGVMEPALFEIYRAGVPVEEKALMDFTEEPVNESLRIAFGRMTWREAIENLQETKKEVYEVFTKEDGVLLKAGFTKDCLDIIITEIYLPDELKKILPSIDRQRIEAEAAQFEAQKTAVQMAGAVISAFSEYTGTKKEEVQKELSQNTEEFITKNKEAWEKAWDAVYRKKAMDSGQYFDLRIPGGGTGLEGLVALFKLLTSGGGKGEKRSYDEREEETPKLSGEEKKQQEEELKEQVDEIQKNAIKKTLEK